tara:strand:+ start:57 stop:566 length:510 start_codon:yes stop_codon:yes gene_type:complete
VKKNLVLLGMMAVGKSTIARIVAKKLKIKFIDIDSIIQKNNSLTIAEIFERKGEKFFRREEEKEVLRHLKKDNSIIALGGGAFINKTIRKNILKTAKSLWMDLDIDIINDRVKNNNKRPLLKKENNRDKLIQLYNKRRKIYELADHKIKCDKLSKIEIAKRIIEIYEKY